MASGAPTKRVGPLWRPMRETLAEAAREGYDGVIFSYLSDAAMRGERGVAWARLMAVILSATREYVFFDSWALLWRGDIDRWVNLVIYLGAGAFSIWSLLVVTYPPRLLKRLIFSVIVDAVMVAGLIGGVVMTPNENWRGLIYLPENGVFILVLITAGFRLSRRVAVIGIAGAAGAAIACNTYDILVNAALFDFDVAHAILWAIIATIAGTLGYVIAGGTRHLVYAGVQAVMKAERTSARFHKYVPSSVAMRAMDTDKLKTGGTRQSVAILFSDLRGFTSYAQQRDPRDLVADLNDYLDVMVQVIQGNGGVVDKFIGDAIMVVFGIPHPDRDDPARAIITADAMQKALTEHNIVRESEGKPPLRHGIGVHYGQVVAGNIGNHDRLQFTVIGDSVNVTSRLEAASKRLDVSTVLSKSVIDAAQGTELELPAVESLGNIELKGWDGELEVYRLVE